MSLRRAIHKKHRAALWLSVVLMAVLTGCGRGVPEPLEGLPFMAPFLSEEQKEKRAEEKALYEAAVPLTEEALREAMRADTAGGKTAAKHCFRTDGTECDPLETFGPMVDALMDDDYLIAYFHAKTEYTAYLKRDALYVDFRYTIKERDVSYADCLEGGRCYFGQYSDDVLLEALIDAAVRGETAFTAVFEKSGSDDFERMLDAVEKEENANEYLLYYLTDARGSASEYGEHMVLTQTFAANEDASRDLIEMDGRTDIDVIREMIGRQSDWRERLVVHHSEGRSWEDIILLAEMASVNDCTDTAAMIDVFRTSEYSNGEGAITEITFDFAEGLTDAPERHAEMMRAVREAEEDLGITPAEQEEGGSAPYSADEARALYRAILDYVCDAADYDHALAEAIAEEEYTTEQYYNMTAYGVFVTGRTVCSGYAAAFKVLCDAAALPCWVVNGQALNEETGRTEGHAWNAVLLDGDVYYIDPTYTDAGWNSRYFLFGTENFDGRERDPGWILPW